ncbi:MAG: hypothetical protein R3D28_04875 [Geminicoccaceae bacterium]
MGSGLDIFQAATLQFAAICNDGPLTELQGGLSSRLGDAVDSGWHFADGGFRLPDRPGIGIEVDANRLGTARIVSGASEGPARLHIALFSDTHIEPEGDPEPRSNRRAAAIVERIMATASSSHFISAMSCTRYRRWRAPKPRGRRRTPSSGD